MSDLVKRLRDRQGRWMTPIFTEAANRIEQLERYLRLEQSNNVKISREIERINAELVAEKALADCVEASDRIDQLERDLQLARDFIFNAGRESGKMMAEIAEEKALSDELFDAWECGEIVSGSSAAHKYRKARGL